MPSKVFAVRFLERATCWTLCQPFQLAYQDRAQGRGQYS